MKQLITAIILTVIPFFSYAEGNDPTAIPQLKGKITDSKTGEPIIGAYVIIKGTSNGAVSDIEGRYTISSVNTGEVTLRCSYLGYIVQEKTIKVAKETNTTVDFELVEQELSMGEVKVLGRRRTSSIAGVLGTIKNSAVVVSGVSAAQISRTSDKDAGEVIKRIPGISVIDERFVVVRGLSQRYNNVWVNGGAVPSSEADGRAFSFDILPSSQIESMLVAKSPSPELPGDFSGGFIKITTKNMPSENSYQIGLATGINTITHSRDTRLSSGSGTDFLGFDNSKRPLSGNFPSHMGTVTDPAQITDLTKHGFNNDWSIKQYRPMPDIKLSFSMSNRINTKGGMEIGVVSALNYNNTYKTLTDVVNRRYGIYSSTADQPTVEKDYVDNQYSNDVRINAMTNWAFKFDNYNRIDFRNLFSVLGKNKLTERQGYSTVSGAYFEKQTEMLYSSRMSYTGQLAGNHVFGKEKDNTIDWIFGYSYANKNEPDRRIISNRAGFTQGTTVPDNYPTYNDRIARYFQKLDDNIFSLGTDYKRELGKGSFIPELRLGFYGEYRTREYQPREFTYRYDRLSHEDQQAYIYLPYEEMMADKWLGYDKVYADEVTSKPDAYEATNGLGAAYAAINLPVGNFNIYAGFRYEFWKLDLTHDRAISPTSQLMKTYNYSNSDILPSVNASYSINEKHLVRAAYGRSVNRPEFREVSPSVHYDFELFAEVQGNPDLKTAYVDNFDLRYEFYPSTGETVSLGLFYKHFKNPIEWNFVDMGGSYKYSYENAKSAQNYGVELDIRKNMDFIGVPELSLVANATFVLSKVQFYDKQYSAAEKDRAMQGQSPYLINAGLYYSSEKLGFSANVLYNIIGKRIMGIGKSNASGGDSDSDLPESYEMPRNTIDFTVSKNFGKHFEIKFGVKDLLAEKVVYKQYPTATINGQKVEREQVMREYRPGTSVSLGVTYKF